MSLSHLKSLIGFLRMKSRLFTLVHESLHDSASASFPISLIHPTRLPHWPSFFPLSLFSHQNLALLFSLAKTLCSRSCHVGSFLVILKEAFLIIQSKIAPTPLSHALHNPALFSFFYSYLKFSCLSLCLLLYYLSPLH